MSHTKKPTPVYRPLLREAFSLTWKRKNMWVFGLFAGLISTGGVMDMTLRSVQETSTQTAWINQFFDQSFIGYPLFANYVQQLLVLGPTHVSWIIITCTLLFVFVILAGVLSQIALILNAKSPVAHHPIHLRKEATAHLLPVLIIDLFTKIATGILMVLISLPLMAFALESTPYHFWNTFLQTLILLPMILCVNILSILAINDSVDRGSKPRVAMKTAWNLFRQQTIATLEYGLILFFIILLMGIGLITLCVLLAIPYTIIYTSVLLTGSLSLFIITNIFFGIVVLGVILAFAGAVVCFQYTAWYRFYKRAMHKQHGQKTFSKFTRWFCST